MSWIEWNRNVPPRICIVCGKRTRAGAAPVGIVSGMFPCCERHGEREIRDAYFELMREHAAQLDFNELAGDSPPPDESRS